MIKNYRAILGAGVWSLAVRGGRVVDFPEKFEKFLVGDFCGVVDDLDGFGVSCFVGADLLVGGVFKKAARVSCGS